MNRHRRSLRSCCEDCEPRALARNHYFTGKLLVERDFTDEQCYFREKLRLHHQRLHGTGVVCGLQIRAAPEPGCQDRLVVLRARHRPSTAAATTSWSRTRRRSTSPASPRSTR